MPRPRPDPSLRSLHKAMADAPDGQVHRIVQVIDAMNSRGDLDTLVDAVRPRLARLRPARPPRLERRLFEPLDPVLVPITRWQNDHPTIPRDVITPLSAAIRQAVPALAEAAANDSSNDEGLGQRLWAEAARVLLDPDIPVDWEDTSLNPLARQRLRRHVGALLSQTAALTALEARVAAGLAETEIVADVIGAIVRDVTAIDPNALPALVVIMLARLPEVMRPLAALAASSAMADGTLRRALESAGGILLSQLELPNAFVTMLAARDLMEVARRVRLIATLLFHMDSDRAPLERRARVRSVRATLAQHCRTRFADALADDFLILLHGCIAACTDEQIVALETTARGLRALETEARKVGGGSIYDDLLDRAGGAIQGVAAPVLDRISRVRLLEIIAGTGAALDYYRESAR